MSAPLIPRRGRPPLVAAALLATCGSVARVGYAALVLPSPWAPAFAQEPGQTVLLVLRVGLLCGLACSLEEEGISRRRQATWLSLAAVLFILSLVARGAIIVFALMTLARMGIAARRSRPEPGAWSAWKPWALLGIALGACLFAGRASTPVVPPATAPLDRLHPQSDIDAWRRAGNAWRARWVAFLWARDEQPPGEGHVALAQCDWDLGRRDIARHVLSKVIAGSAPLEVREHAQSLEHEWAP